MRPYDVASALSSIAILQRVALDPACAWTVFGAGGLLAPARDRGGDGLEIEVRSVNCAVASGNPGCVDVHVHCLCLFLTADYCAARQRPAHAAHYWPCVAEPDHQVFVD